jgi:hypothetical protein
VLAQPIANALVKTSARMLRRLSTARAKGR